MYIQINGHTMFMNKGIINMTVPPNWSSISTNSIKIPRGLFLFAIELDNLFLNFMWKLKANDKQEWDRGRGPVSQNLY